MAEYSANAVQTVQPGAFAVFTATTVPCFMGLIQHEDDSPLFSLSGRCSNTNTCCCKRNRSAMYDTTVNMNVALSADATVAPISVALAVGGVAYPLSQMDSTPAAIQQFNHIGTELSLPILNGCCQYVAVQNTSTQPIDIRNLVIKFERSDV